MSIESRATDATCDRATDMKPYWITFERIAAPSYFNLGVGITANSKQDALEILSNTLPEAPPVAGVAPIRDMRELDQAHVAPNMGNWLLRGVWFPRGHE